jgi:hypothetical protein
MSVAGYIQNLPPLEVRGRIPGGFPGVCNEQGKIMAKATLVSASDNDTGRGLLSEVLGIPLLIRGEPSTSLLSKSDLSRSFGLPTLSRSKPFSKLTSGGPIFGFLPMLTKGK